MKMRILLSVMLVLAMCLTASADTIIANFDGGNSTTIADAYTGMAGDGWAAPWVFGTDTSSYTEAGVLTSGDAGFQELKSGSGNYLHFEVSAADNGGEIPRSISREYKSDTTGINWAESYTIDFTLRIDEADLATQMNDYRDRYMITESSRAHLTSGSPYDSAFIMATGTTTENGGATSMQWGICPGSGSDNGTLGAYIGSGVALVSGGVYDFSLTIDPANQTWGVSITDGTTSFTGSDYYWRKGSDDVGGFLTFIGQAKGENTVRSMSIDSIVINQETATVPEPSTLVGLFFLLTIGGCCLRKNRNG